MTDKSAMEPFTALYWSRRTSLAIRVSTFSLVLLLSVQQTMFFSLDRFMFLTSQAEVMILLYGGLAILHQLTGSTEGRFITILKQSCFHISISIHFMVCIFYWAILASKDFHQRISIFPTRDRRIFEWAASLLEHLGYCLYMWFVLVTEKTNLKPHTFKYLLLYCLSYAFFNFLVTVSRGEPVYPVLTWKSPATAIYLLVAFGLSFLGFWLSLKVSQNMNRTLHLLA